MLLRMHAVNVILRRKEVSIDIDKDEVSVDEDARLETYFHRLIKISRLNGTYFSPKAHWATWIVNGCIILFVFFFSAFTMVSEVNLVTSQRENVDIELSTILCGIAWNVQSLISMFFLIYWQVNGDMWTYMEDVMAHQKGDCIKKRKDVLKRYVWFSRSVFLCFLSTLVVYNMVEFEVIQDSFGKYEIFTNPFLKVIQACCFIHLFLCWNLAIFLFNILISGTLIEIKHYNEQLDELNGQNEEDLKKKLIAMIISHTRIAKNIKKLDSLLGAYAFVMVATIIPSTLLTLLMLAHSVDGYIDALILALPSLFITTYGFLGLTLSPARLYHEMSRSKNYLCQNLSLWEPYRPEIYNLNMVLCAHMDQPNLGMTIWGFAVLSKPLILATLSGMIMLLSFILEIAPTLTKIIEQDNDEAATSLNSTLS